MENIHLIHKILKITIILSYDYYTIVISLEILYIDPEKQWASLV